MRVVELLLRLRGFYSVQFGLVCQLSQFGIGVTGLYVEWLLYKSDWYDEDVHEFHLLCLAGRAGVGMIY